MEEYISKSAVVAEIERRRRDWRYGSSIEAKYKREECDDILSFLDTLEGKEVDLEKEVDDVMKRFLGNITCREEQLKFAKYFYELGLSVSNESQKGE